MTTYPNQYLALQAVALLVLGLSGPAVAHNGAVAIAVPVEGITIDGDLSDWPEGLVRYPVALHVYGDKPEGGDDIQGFFRIGYHARENALYVAVEVQDESVVVDTTAGARGNTQDGCLVYVDERHEREDAPSTLYILAGTIRQGPEQEAEVEVR